MKANRRRRIVWIISFLENKEHELNKKKVLCIKEIKTLNFFLRNYPNINPFLCHIGIDIL